jgi:hypothetical protein
LIWIKNEISMNFTTYMCMNMCMELVMQHICV